MTSGPCMIMVLTNASGENVCAEFREYIGNKDPVVAKQENPDCLRAIYGENTVKNGIHGSEPGEAAQKETALVVALMPDLVIPNRPPKPRLMQFMILIPPDLVATATEKVKAVLEQNEFRIIRCEEISVNDEIVDKIFDHVRKDDIEEFGRLHKTYATGEPSVVLVVEKMEGIPAWIALFGPNDVAEAHETAPDSLVAQIYPADSGVTKNSIYFATAPSRGRQDATFMLRHLDVVKPLAKPEFTIAAIKPDALLQRDVILQRIHEAGFQIIDRIERKLTSELVMRMYINHQGQGYFTKVMDHLTSGPTMFLILYREEAIIGWRSLMGPSDPAKAKSDAPDSIRAMIGQDVIRNAVFGADSANEAMHLLHLVWGQNAEITEDGRLEKAQPIPSRPASSHARKTGDTPSTTNLEPPAEAHHEPPVHDNKASASPPPNASNNEPVPKLTNVHNEPIAESAKKRPTIMPAKDFDAKADCEWIQEAIEGLSPDKETMTWYIACRSWQQRVAIAKMYKEMYNVDLTKAFNKKYGASLSTYKNLLTSLTRSPTELAAHSLQKLFKDPLVADQDSVAEIICTTPTDQLQAVKAEFEKAAKKPLEAAVEEKIKEPLRGILLQILEKDALPSTAVDTEAVKKDIAHLNEELPKGAEEADSALSQLFAGRSPAHIEAAFRLYKQTFGKGVYGEIADAFSSDEKYKNAYLTVVGPFVESNIYLAKRLRIATEAIGAKDNLLNRIIVARCEIDLEDIKNEYEKQFGTSLAGHVRGYTVGNYRDGLLAIIEGDKDSHVPEKTHSPLPKTNSPHPPSIPPSPVPEAAEKKAPSRTGSKASLNSVTKSVKEAPTPAKGSPVVKGQPTHSPANASRRSSNASIKSQAKTKPTPTATPPVASPHEPATASPHESVVPEPAAAAADEEEAKPVDG